MLRLLLVPRTGIGSVADPFRPLLPESISWWGQASSLFERDRSEPDGAHPIGRVLVYANCTDDDLQLVESMAGEVRDPLVGLADLRAAMRDPDGRAAELTALHLESMQLHAAALVGDEQDRIRYFDSRARFADEARGHFDRGRALRREFLETYRDAAARIEDELPSEPPLFGLGDLYTDDFNRSATLDGSTTSTGGGTWDVPNGSFATVTTCVSGAGGVNNAYITDMTAIGRMRVSAIRTTGGSDWATIARADVDANGYWAYGGAAAFRLYKSSGGLTLLGTGTTISGTPTLGVDVDGSSISAYYNGSLDIGPVTDSAVATGKAGMYAFDAGRAFDDFRVEEEGAPSPIACAVTAGASVVAALSGAGALACAVVAGAAVAAALAGSGSLALAASGGASCAAQLHGSVAAAVSSAGAASVAANLRGSAPIACVMQGTSICSFAIGSPISVGPRTRLRFGYSTFLKRDGYRTVLRQCRG
jgi:hypothetical protein